MNDQNDLRLHGNKILNLFNVLVHRPVKWLWRFFSRIWRGINVWARANKPIIELLAVAAALITLYIIYDQTKEIANQTGAIVEQNKVMNERNKAIWYSYRPIIRIKPINPNRDIVAQDSSDSRFVYISEDSIGYFDFHFSTENIGQSYALIDTVGYALMNSLLSDSLTVGLFRVQAPGELIVDNVFITLKKTGTNTLRLFYVFKWEKPDNLFERFEFIKYYLIRNEDNVWRVNVLSKLEYEDHNSTLSRRP